MSIIDQNNVGTLYYIFTDHLGSPNLITDASGNTVQELSFDAWGQRRNPATWQPYTSPAPTPLIDRGFTFHEHYYDLKLINMQGRMYDPVPGRFLSPDPFTQAPEYTQSYNRYSYAFNNPLLFTDPSGFVAIDDTIGQDGRIYETFTEPDLNGVKPIPFSVIQFANEHQLSRDEINEFRYEMMIKKDYSYYHYINPDGTVTTRFAEKGLEKPDLDPIDAAFAVGSLLKIAISRSVAMTAEKILAREVAETAAKTGTKAVLEGAVESNFKRFVSKIPANSKGSATYELLEDGNYLFKATSPGKVRGSSALYEKWVNSLGETFKMNKTTFAPDGSIIHIKPKL
jgi:RHS repeat-associated protein